MTTMEERIQRGMELLDKEKPGWREKIDCTTLQLEDPTMCVLGQVYSKEAAAKGSWASGFGIGHNDLGITEMAHEYGFDVRFDYDLGGDSESYLDLTEAWKEALGC